MTPKYLTEYAEPARMALDLAMREAQPLSHTTKTLYAMPIDLPGSTTWRNTNRMRKR